MEVDVRELGGSRVTMHVRLSEQEVQSAFDRTYQQLSNRGGVKGFRPGKVPRSILERHYDAEAIRAATYETLVQDRLEEAMDERDLRPVDQVNVKVGAPPDEDEALAETIKAGLVRDEGAEEAAEDEEHECGPDCDHDHEDEIALVEGEPFEFYTVFTAYPRPTLPDLSGLKLRRPVEEVAEDEVSEQLEQLRRINAEEVQVDRETIEDGDLVVADVKVVVEGEDADEVKPSSQEIVVGERDYLGDIDEALIGHKPGDVVEAAFEYGEDHPDEDLRGKPARIIAEIDSFSGRQLPELTDEFAQGLGDFQSLNDLRGSIRSQLQAAADERSHEELRGQVLRHILEGTEIDLPEEFVDRAAERSYEQLRNELQQMGMSLTEFAEATGADEVELRDNQRARAESGLKLHFAMEALADKFGVEATAEDVTAELQRIAEEAGGDFQFVQQAAMVQPGFAEEVQERAQRRRLVEQIISEAEVEDVPAAEYAKEREAPTEGVTETVTQSDEEAGGEAPNPSDDVAAETDQEGEAE